MIVDWEAARRELGVADGEKLYYGFDVERPEAHVPESLYRLRPGTPVYLDGRPLRRWFYLFDDEILTRDDLLAEYDFVPFEGLSAEAPNAPEDFNYLVDSGSSIYDWDDLYGDEELAINILYDLCGGFTARRRYLEFAREVVAELPHTRPKPRARFESASVGKQAEWFLPEKAIRGWLWA